MSESNCSTKGLRHARQRRERFNTPPRSLKFLRAVLLISATLLAQSSLAQDLRYEAPDTCPNEVSFRDRVQARLGRDPFNANVALTVEIVAVGRRFQGRITSDGAERAFPATRNCGDLVDSLAAVAAVLLEAYVVPPPEVQQEPATAEPPVAVTPTQVHEAESPFARAPPTPAPEPERRPRFDAALTAGLRWGSLPEMSTEVALWLGWQMHRYLDLRLSGRGNFQLLHEGNVAGWEWSVGPELRTHLGAFSLGVGVLAGLTTLRSEDTTERASITAPRVDVEAVAGFRYPARSSIAFVLEGDLRVALLQTQWQVDSTASVTSTIFETPRLSGGIRTGLVLNWL